MTKGNLGEGNTYFFFFRTKSGATRDGSPEDVGRLTVKLYITSRFSLFCFLSWLFFIYFCPRGLKESEGGGGVLILFRYYSYYFSFRGKKKRKKTTTAFLSMYFFSTWVILVGKAKGR